MFGSLPGERTKNKKRHEVPLSRASAGHLDSMPAIAGSDFVFTSGQSAGSAISAAAKQLIDAQMKPADAVGPARSSAHGGERNGAARNSSCR